MSQAETLRRQIADLEKKISDIQREVARWEGEATKHRKQALAKTESANRASSFSQSVSYLKAAQDEQKRAADADKKVGDSRKKLADASRSRADKINSLERAEKQDRTAQDRESERRRQKEISHAREVARISAPALKLRAITPPKPEPLRVLYLTANPEASESEITQPDGSVHRVGTFLRTEAEVKQVKDALRGSPLRDLVSLDLRSAAGFQDILDGINDSRPHVVHFSGHGGCGGILMDNGSVADPQGVDMGYQSLANFLAATDDPPKLLVLNACDTLDGADVLLPSVPVVIAMSDTISDIGAAVFASKFYAAIASGQSVGAALRQAKAVMEMTSIGDAHLPEAITRPDIEIDNLILIERRNPD